MVINGSLDVSLTVFDVHVVILKPLECIPWIIVINHSSDVEWVVPKVSKSSRDVVGLCVVFVHFVAQPGCEQGKTFSDILGVRVHEC